MCRREFDSRYPHNMKNKYISFLLSLIPGCGHFYLGFYRRGIFVAIVFFGTLLLEIILLVSIDYPYLNDAFGFLLALVYFWAINDALRVFKYHLHQLGKLAQKA